MVNSTSLQATIDQVIKIAFQDDSPAKTHNWPDPIMNFLVAYDIADPKRLRLVAKLLEASARRVQKSVFVFTGSRRQLDDLLGCAVQYIEPTVDRIQAWPVRTSNRTQRADAGAALPATR